MTVTREDRINHEVGTRRERHEALIAEWVGHLQSIVRPGRTVHIVHRNARAVSVLLIHGDETQHSQDITHLVALVLHRAQNRTNTLAVDSIATPEQLVRRLAEKLHGDQAALHCSVL